MVETLLINETLVSRFKFWQDGQLHHGMRYRQELFRQAATFYQHQRQQAFDLSWALTQDGGWVVVTAKEQEYTVWVSLRSRSEMTLRSRMIHSNR